MLLPRRVVIAFALSLGIHGVIFTALALIPEPSLEPPPPQVEEPVAETPLEVVITPSPEREEEKAAAALAVAVPENPALMLPSLGADAERTELDPRNLRRSETAPEEATRLAAHHAMASRMRGGGSAPPALPAPTPRPDRAGRPQATPPPAVSETEAGVSLAAVGPGTGEEEDGGEAGSEAAVGVFRKAVSNAIGVRWDHYRRTKMALLGVGSVRIKFVIDARGKVSDLRVTANTAGPEAALCAVRAITEAEIPPIPPERLARIPEGRLEVEYSFTIFPTQ